ncbi:hypothetical protein [Membranihabitans maritimus]|uniref:hypothetical protein n=1 Tax=Membranihabitans maritimus TaxID=2904244 RepID=UPI001F1BC11E|nr:hypothetical protein [Membranihabitans maritimus]
MKKYEIPTSLRNGRNEEGNNRSASVRPDSVTSRKKEIITEKYPGSPAETSV